MNGKKRFVAVQHLYDAANRWKMCVERAITQLSKPHHEAGRAIVGSLWDILITLACDSASEKTRGDRLHFWAAATKRTNGRRTAASGRSFASPKAFVGRAIRVSRV